MSRGPLARRLARATATVSLETNVLRATDASVAHRAEAVAERPDWEQLRTRAAALRDHTLTNLDRYVQQFCRAARARGAVVHAAADAAQAREIVLDLVRARGALRVLKSKSMTTEEIELNAALEAAGGAPLETDLGEYIVQLAGEPPSHITAPALHRSAEEILDLFAKHGVLGDAGPPPTDRAELATWLSLRAREHLRDRLLEADVGITGANFAVAETGTLVLVENEGNIRFTVTSPPVQIAIVGTEKLVPRIEDLATLLPLLTRSATGQRASSYVQLIGGPVGEALHVVLLDGGRSRILCDADDREILRCIRCGACLNVCPVYRTIGGHPYGSAYPGPIGALLTPLLRGRPGDGELPWLSTLCGACTEVCPVGIDLSGHLLRLRGRTVSQGRRPPAERLAMRAFSALARRPRAWRFVLRLARPCSRIAARLRWPRSWGATRDVPPIARPTFQEGRDHGPSPR